MSDVLLLPYLWLISLPIAGSLILQCLTHSQPCKKSLSISPRALRSPHRPHAKKASVAFVSFLGSFPRCLNPGTGH